VVTSLRRRNIIGDEIDDLSGLISKAPVEAVLMLTFLLSLSGIPPFAGFWGKYFVFLSLIETGHMVLAAVGILFSVLGLYYYMRMANAMFMKKPMDSEPVAAGVGMRLALLATGLGTIIIGIFPNFFINAATHSLSLPVSSSMIGLIR
jgi:NADH-quinone oxidoreductase subunit N